MITINNISKKFNERIILDNINMEIHDNCITALVGQNGAGKSTLLKILTGILEPDSGSFYFDDIKKSSKLLYNKIGYLPEQRGLYYDVDVEKQLMYFCSLRGICKHDTKAAIQYWLNIFDANNWRKKKISELSKGMQQKVQLMVCLLHNPQYVFMDEPLSGIDPVNFEIFTNAIIEYQQRTHSTIILSTHNMKSIEKMCNYVVFLDNKKIRIYDSIQNIKNKFSNINTFTIILESNTLVSNKNGRVKNLIK